MVDRLPSPHRYELESQATISVMRADGSIWSSDRNI